MSGPAAVRYAQASARELRLPGHLARDDPASPAARRSTPPAVAAALSSPRKTVRDAAASIARRLSRNLANILIALRLGDPATRDARPDWVEDAWRLWAGIRHVVVGGGLVSGAVGAHLVHHANALLGQTAGVPLLSEERSRRTRHVSLIGAARYLPHVSAASRCALCMDFGQTSVKRAVACVSGNAPCGLEWLPPVPIPWPWYNDPRAGEQIEIGGVFDFVTQTLVDGLRLARQAGHDVGPWVATSIAVHTAESHLHGNVIYARMHNGSRDVFTRVEDRVRALGGGEVVWYALHDGTAAAACYAGQPATAAILVGTALGVGFAPVEDNLLLEDRIA